MGTLDPSGLLAGTREVYWWAAWSTVSIRDAAVTEALRSDATVRGSQVTGFRYLLLDAWSRASRNEHDRLRLGFPEYAGAILMWQLGGVTKVAELLLALETDVADIRSARPAVDRRG